MNRLKRCATLAMSVMLAVTLCACQKEKKQDLFSQESYQNRSDRVVNDGWTDGIDDQYVFEYELSIEPKTKIEGVIVTGISDPKATDIQILKTRVSRFNDPKTIFGIGPGAFANQTTIEAVVLSDTVVVIYEKAFEGCTNLKTVELTPTVWLIENNAFSGCNSLKTIRYSGTKAQFEQIRCEDQWVPAGQNITIVCADGSISADNSGSAE